MSFESHWSWSEVSAEKAIVKFTQFSESSVDMESMTEDYSVIGR